MSYLIKDTAIIICYIYCYVKILGIKNIKRKEILFGTLILSVTASFIDRDTNYIGMMAIFGGTVIILYSSFNRKINFPATLLSFSISYILHTISTAISSLLILLLPLNINKLYLQMLSFVLQMVLMNLVFVNKRMKNGMPFLNRTYYYGYTGMILGLLILALAIILNIGNYSIKILVFYLFLLILSIFLFIYWHTSITRHYLERLSLRNIDSLNDELEEKNEYIRRLLEDKERLEKLNHKNYKLIPALQGAVMHYLEGVSTFIEINADNPALAELAAAQEINMKEFITEGNRLMNDIKELQSEWKEMVDSDDIEGIKEVPKCGVTRVDYLLSYTYERSKKENFSFRADVDSDLSGITEKIISEADLATLIADLIENAIIATKYNDGKDILVRMGIMKKEYVIEIYDSGVKFDKDVLLKYGVEKITTHADDNGSGIGMMQTYEILNNCGASIYIDELSDKSGLFTKRISIVFNKKNQYVLYTKRDDDEVAYLHKRSDLLIIKK